LSSKIKCIILDDELPGLTYLKMLCEQLPFIEVERCFNSPELFLKEYKNINFEVCLLDINMPDINGIEIAQLLQDKQVIFTSAYPEFAVNAFEIEACDFIKKPVTKERLEKALLKAQKQLNEGSVKTFFSWNTNIGKSTIYFNEILYITTSEIDKRDKTIHLQDNNQLILKNITLEKLLSLLPSHQFLQVNKADIVTKKVIQAYTADEIVLKTQNKTKTILNLGESFRKNFTSWMQN
jgi:DNA-binding LytR/AlgR family response regulator